MNNRYHEHEFRASAPFRVVQFAVANPTPAAADHPSPTDPLNQPNKVNPRACLTLDLAKVIIMTGGFYVTKANNPHKSPSFG